VDFVENTASNLSPADFAKDLGSWVIVSLGF